MRAHVTELVGELVRHAASHRPCYVRGPEWIIVEVAEKIERAIASSAVGDGGYR